MIFFFSRQLETVPLGFVNFLNKIQQRIIQKIALLLYVRTLKLKLKHFIKIFMQCNWLYFTNKIVQIPRINFHTNKYLLQSARAFKYDWNLRILLRKTKYIVNTSLLNVPIFKFRELLISWIRIILMLKIFRFQKPCVFEPSKSGLVKSLDFSKLCCILNYFIFYIIDCSIFCDVLRSSDINLH